MSKSLIIDLSNKTRLISFDPGDNTGWVRLARTNPDEQWCIIEGGTFDEKDLIELDMIMPQDLLTESDETLVIYEQMQVFNRHISTKGLEVTGAIRLRSKQLRIESYPRDPSYLQGPRKWPLQLEERWKKRHIFDALIHAIVVLGHVNIAGIKIGIK